MCIYYSFPPKSWPESRILTETSGCINLKKKLKVKIVFSIFLLFTVNFWKFLEMFLKIDFLCTPSIFYFLIQCLIFFLYFELHFCAKYNFEIADFETRNYKNVQNALRNTNCEEPIHFITYFFNNYFQIIFVYDNTKTLVSRKPRQVEKI